MILVAGHGVLAAEIGACLKRAGQVVERSSDNCLENGLLEADLLARARALILAGDDDAGNVDLALAVRRRHPGLPLVVRLFDATLAAYLTESISAVRILSMSQVSAPVFVAAAQEALNTLPRPEPVLPGGMLSGHSRGSRVDRMLLLALCCLLLLVFPSALVFAQALDMRYMDALYFVWTTVMTVGYGDIALKDAPDLIKLFGMLLMLAGAGFIAVLFALLSDWALSRRLDFLNGRIRVRGHGHVLIVGAGNVGFRVAEHLSRLGRRLVVIEREADSRNLSLLKTQGQHVIVADATQPAMLDLAGLHHAALVIAVTDSDTVNLQVALFARRFGVPVVMRMTSPELSAHVTARGDGVAFAPLLAAAEAFAGAAMEMAAA